MPVVLARFAREDTVISPPLGSADPEGPRYEKVILTTDADVDGMHIRNLIIPHFFLFFEQFVHDGHVHVLATPLFRVRNQEKTTYCYREAERDKAVMELGGEPEITRFKGLAATRSGSPGAALQQK